MSQHETGTVKPTVSKLSSYVWEVKNYSTICKNNARNGDCVISPIFSTVYSSIEHKWCLRLYPKGETEALIDHISIYLKYLGQSNIEVRVILSLLDGGYCKVNEHIFQRLYEKGSSSHGYAKFEKQNFITDNANQVLVNDTIHILCEIIYISDNFVPLKNKCAEETLPDYCRLKEFDEFEKLLEAENSTDVTIRIGKDEIKVHKAIIMSRSSVFQAMFQHNMKEKEESVVEITDIKFEVMKEVFRFMYAGKVNEVEQNAGDLLVAAEKYSISGLKVLSEKQLFKNLTVTNAIEYLKLADMCNATNLKSEIINFIVRNQKEVIEKPELQLLPMEVVCEVFRAVVRDNSNN